MLKLHYDPASTTCRPIRHFAAEAGVPLQLQVVDLFSDENRGETFTRLNPNQAVPVLEHDGFVLTESSAILKYLADYVGSPAYPTGLRERARVNEMMDWFNTGFMRDVGYGLVYARVLKHYRLPGPGFEQALAIHAPRAERRFQALDTRIGSGVWLCGADITIADYFGAAFATLPELIGYDIGRWPNVGRWIATMKSQPAWDEINAAFYGWRSAVQAQPELLASARGGATTSLQ